MKNTNNQFGFAHLLLLLLVLVLLIGGTALVFFKSANIDVSNSVSNILKKEEITVSPTTTPIGLEEELDGIELTNLDEDFETIDKDIEEL